MFFLPQECYFLQQVFFSLQEEKFSPRKKMRQGKKMSCYHINKNILAVRKHFC